MKKLEKSIIKKDYFISPEIFTKGIYKFYKDNPDLQQKHMNKEQMANYKMMTGFDAVDITDRHIAQIVDLIGWFLSRDFPEKSEDAIILEMGDGYLKIESYS